MKTVHGEETLNATTHDDVPASSEELEKALSPEKENKFAALLATVKDKCAEAGKKCKKLVYKLLKKEYVEENDCAENGAQDSEGEKEESLEEITGRTLSPGRIVMKRFFRSKLSMTGLVILIALFLFSFFGPLFDVLPFIWGEKESDRSTNVEKAFATEVIIDADVNNEYAVYDETEGASNKVYIIVKSSPKNNQKPSANHWLGTDDKGFDVLSRLMYGGRISLTLGFVVVLLETLLGVVLGGISGYFGKWVDQIIMRIVDIFNCVPTLPMLMIVGVALESLNMYGPERLYIMMAMMTLFGWAGTARLVRGQILSLREQDFMLSAEASGLTIRRKIFKHLIPNVLPQLIVSMTLGLGSVILMEATLGYLGIGLPTEYATWGNMINAAANSTALRLYPHLWIPPGVCIVLAVLAFNFVGDGLRDAFDPKARR
ncbi:MAG: ABC transporter permease [Clostridia bacterium]|nr:ABC transporter permease [Clostridia bacterium]